MSMESIGTLQEMHVDDRSPYGLHVWLHSCYLETLQPTVGWLQIEDGFAKSLASLLKKREDMSNEENLALLKLVGAPFIMKYLPNIPVHPCISQPSPQILQDMQTWLKQQVQLVASDLGFDSLFSCNTLNEKASDKIQLLRRRISTVAQNNLNLFLLKDEQERKKNKTKDGKNHASSLLSITVNEVQQLQSRHESKGSRKSPEQAANFKKVLHDNEISMEMCSHQSESIGQIVSSILFKHPSKTSHVISALSGHRLPLTLRRYLWRESLFESQKHLLNKGNIEQFLRLEFGQTIQQNCQELKIKHATKSPINCLIENAVIEIYSKTPNLQRFATDTHLKEACRVLNVLYVYGRTYKPYLIHWLLALQVTFHIDTKNPLQVGEHVYELALYLTLLRTSCFPDELHMLTAARQVLDNIKEHDPVLYTHLQQISKVNLKNHSKEGLLRDDAFSEERQKRKNSVSSNLIRLNITALKHSDSFSAESLMPDDPVFFIFKWIREAFASVLNTAAMLWVWDQCFLQHWNPKVFRDVSVALVLLLRTNFLDATDNAQMTKVFFSYPSQIFTKDIQEASIHIQSKRPLSEVPKINRQNFQRYRKVDIPDPDPSFILENLTGSKSMTSFVLENVHLKLEFLPSVLKEKNGKVFQIPWMKSLNMDNIVINVRSQFCQTTIDAKHVSGPHANVKTKVDVAGRLIISLPVDCIFQFKSYDVIPYKSEIKEGGYPYAIINILYIEGVNIVPLGWTCIPLVELDAWNNQKWTGIHQQQMFFPLHPGDIPIELCVSEAYIPEDEINFSKYLLGYNSEITLTLTIEEQNPINNNQEETNNYEQKCKEGNHETESWVEHIPPEELVKLEAKATCRDAVDVYIDCVRFIPDSASIIKVTVTLLGSNSKGISQSKTFLPNLDSPARCPTFSTVSSRLELNLNQSAVSPKTLLLVTISTVEMLSGQLATLGNCLMSLYHEDDEKNVVVRVGGHQLSVQSGIVLTSGQGKNLSISAVASFPSVPAASVLIRILPHSMDAIPAPSYFSGYYKSEDCKPNSSEERILQSYKDQSHYPTTVKDMIWKLQALHQIQIEEGKEEIQAWYERQMANSQMVKGPDKILNVLQCIWYRSKIGLWVKVKRAFQLPSEDLYVQCFGQIHSSQQKSGLIQAGETEEKFITLKHDYESQLKSPVWQNEDKLLHPPYDENACLVIQLIGIKVAYHPSTDHKQPGIICSPEGSDLEFSDDAVIAWTALNLFDKNAVETGCHHVPLVPGKPSVETLQRLSEESASSVLLQMIQKNKNKSSLLVSLWDGHFIQEEVPLMPLHEDLLQASKFERLNRKSSIESSHGNVKGDTGKRFSDLVLENLEKKIQLKGTSSQIYKKEQEFFEKIVTDKFHHLVESLLLTAGSGPL